MSTFYDGQRTSRGSSASWERARKSERFGSKINNVARAGVEPVSVEG